MTKWNEEHEKAYGSPPDSNDNWNNESKARILVEIDYDNLSCLENIAREQHETVSYVLNKIIRGTLYKHTCANTWQPPDGYKKAHGKD